MKILHVCQSDSFGGAAIAARRLHHALCAAGEHSRMLVLRKDTEDPTIVAPLGLPGRASARAARFVCRRIGRLAARHDRDGMRSLGIVPTGLAGAINRESADVVHLHWLGSEAASIAEIGRIRAPLFWTLHDVWPFSGAHHWGRLTEPAGSTAGPFDLEEWVLARKARHWRDLGIHFICPSQWMADQLSESSHFGQNARSVIPNTLDTSVFRPRDKTAARRELGLPDAPLLLFGAVHGASDPIKGGDFLRPILDGLESRGHRPTIAVFGGSVPQDLSDRAIALGYLDGDTALAKAYAAADVFVCPSRTESLSNTIIEAQACDVPAVAFSSSGQVDAIGSPSWLSPPFDCAHMAATIASLLEAPPQPGAVRKATVDRFSNEAVSDAHVALYRRRLSAER